MGKYKAAIRALADTYQYFDDGFLQKLRDDTYKFHLRGWGAIRISRTRS